MKRTLVALLLAWALPLAAAMAPPLSEKGSQPRMLDARVNLKDSYRRATAARPGKAAAGLELARQQVASIAAAVAAKKTGMPGLDLRLSGITAGPEVVRNTGGALTPASSQRSEDIVRGFLSQNGALYGLSAGDVDDLVVLGDSPGGLTGLRMLRMEQRIDGWSVFQSETRFILDRAGRLMGSSGRMVPHARSITPTANSTLTPVQAIIKLMAVEGKTVDAAALSLPPASGEWIQIEETDNYIAGTISARQVLFPIGPGQLVPAWALVVFTSGDQDWYAIVDAETGDLLWRKNIRNSVSIHDARFRVFVQADGTTPADSPAPSSPNTVTPGSGTQFSFLPLTIVSMHTAMNAIASPNGWINDCPGGICTANETQTLGNNTLTCLDRTVGVSPTFVGRNVCDTDAAGVLDGNGRPTGNPDATARNRDFLGTAPRDFQTNFLPPPQTTAADAEAGQDATGNGNNGTLPVDIFRRGAVTQLFYITNWYHDKLFALGFDEASGNFQQTNFSGMGLGGDRVLGDAQDGSGTNNANFATPPDGVSGRMQMFRFTGPTIDRDGGLDAEIVMHELTHGTSNRLVGNGAGLNWDPAGGLGEGWSDFYALSLLNNTNADNPNGHYASGGYGTYKLIPGYLDNYLYGIRRFPYTTDNTVNPMTWADVDDVTNSLTGGIAPSPVNFNDNGGMEVHNSGEIWALTLWEVRSRVIADPAGANGDVPTGNTTMLQLVTNALKMTPIDPSFTDARDALFAADCATNAACVNENSIWGGFADRGLGYRASTPYNVVFGLNAAHLGVHESFLVPYLDVVDAGTDVAIDDSASNNNGRVDPGEAVRLTVSLTNPWRAPTKNVASATATLTTTTPGVNIYDNTATWGAIPAQGKRAASDSFLITLDTTVACGSSINFTMTTTSSLGTTATTFTLRVGNANGTNAVVTYTKDTTPDMPIIDGRPRASAIDTLNITDDFRIADLDFRIDSVTHTFTGDLTFMLRSPGGIGTDFVSVIGGLAPDKGSGDNILMMVMDDDIANTAANDMVQAPAASAPFTKSWVPVFNGPWAVLAGFPPSDPVGNLSRYDGTSTLGTWTIAGSDQFSVDTGTLNAWSILVTPVHFDCVAFAPAALLRATKTVAGTFLVGGTVTYIVIITNSGTDNQGDNPGNEFTDVLPAGLTLVNATATSGTALATIGTNTVTWNGSLAPLGGSVTITITATINVGTQATTISNQGSLSYDGNNDNVNEASGVTDDPGVVGATDPTIFLKINSVPVLAAIGNRTVAETVLLSFTISATDADGDPITYGASNLPTGATLNPTTGAFSWTPTFSQAGSYPGVVFTASDNHSGADSRTITIAVTNTNRAPVLNAITAASTAAGTTLSFTESATDPDGDSIAYSASLPAGATLNPTTGVFSWRPATSQVGPITITITATDNASSPLSNSKPAVLYVAPAFPAADFGGDNKRDVIVQHSTTRDIAMWTMNGLAISSTTFVGSPGAYTIAGLGDFNGDGKGDVLLRDSLGNIGMWLMNGPVITGGFLVGSPGAYDVVAVADFNGDGKSDILLRDSLGNVGVWLMNGPIITLGAPVGSPGGYAIVAAADFNGDGKADILLRDPLGNIGMWQMNGPVITAGFFVGSPAGYQVVGVGDFDGSGKADIMLRDSLGNVGIWFMNGHVISAGALVGSPGAGYEIATIGDYNGDGKADVLLRNTASGDVGMWLMNGSVITAGASVATPGAVYDVH